MLKYQEIIDVLVAKNASFMQISISISVEPLVILGLQAVVQWYLNKILGYR